MTVQTDFEASTERVREQLLRRGVTAAGNASAQTVASLAEKYSARPKAESPGATTGARPWAEIVASLNADPGATGLAAADPADISQRFGKAKPWGEVLGALGIARKA